MKLIELSKTSKTNAGKYFAQVDDADFDWLNQWSWYVLKRKQKDKYYAYTKKKVGISMHGKIMNKSFEDKHLFIDHKDGNGLNNQRHNLRLCTLNQNNANKTSTGKSIYLGVYPSGQKWVAQICTNWKLIYLGTFKTQEEAALVYNKKALEIHGEFARLNIIEPKTQPEVFKLF